MKDKDVVLVCRSYDWFGGGLGRWSHSRCKSFDVLVPDLGLQKLLWYAFTMVCVDEQTPIGVAVTNSFNAPGPGRGWVLVPTPHQTNEYSWASHHIISH